MAIKAISQLAARERRGTSITEVVVAIILLSTATIGVGKMMFQSNGGIRAMEQRRGLTRELENARAIIGSWPADEVTVDKILQLPFSSNVEPFAESIAWKATVSSIDEPASVLQVTLAIEVTWNQQTSTPNQLTFWIPRGRAVDGDRSNAKVSIPTITEGDAPQTEGGGV